MPTPRPPAMSDSTLSPTIAAWAGSRPSRRSAMRNSGGSGLPTTIGRTPAAALTAATMAPQPGRKSPSSIGIRGSTLGVTSGAPAAAARAAAARRSYERSKSLPTATTVARR